MLPFVLSLSKGRLELLLRTSYGYIDRMFGCTKARIVAAAWDAVNDAGQQAKRAGARMAHTAIAYPLLWSGASRSLLGSGLLLGVLLLALLLVVFWRFVAHDGAPFAGYSAITRGPLFPAQGL